ncbi:MAG: hypothetical protein HGA80_00255 [Candidatus Omnitrophica bacterium]|nr:hypothetical protein [Candidatus Omnitrophota bacterium]
MLTALLLLIFIRPFICSLSFPDLNFVYLMVLVSVLSSWVGIKGLSTKGPRATAAWLAVLAVLAYSIFLSDANASAIEKLLQHIAEIMLLLVCRSMSRQDTDRLIRTLVAAGLLVALMGIYQYLFVLPRTLATHPVDSLAPSMTLDYIRQKRVNYPLLTPNVLGSYLIMLFPLAFALRKRPLIIATPLLVTLLLTQSLGALGSMLVALLIYYSSLGKLTRLSMLLLFGAGAAILVLYHLRAATDSQCFQPIFSSAMRLSYWQQTWQIIQAHPWTGIGMGNFDLYNSRYSHNACLQIWAETGIFGLAAFLGASLGILKTGWDSVRHAGDKTAAALLCAASAFFLHNLVDFTFFLPETSLIWFAILGILWNRGVEPGHRADR